MAAARWRTPSFSRQVTEFLKQQFQNRWTERQSPADNRPPRSPDLTSLDYNLLGIIMSLVCAVRSSTKTELLNRIMAASTHMRSDKASATRSVT
jgi:hypothetical protein